MLKVFLRKIKTMVRKPKMILIKILRLISPFLNDKVYLKLLFPLSVGYQLDLNNPSTYNQKLQWLKLYYRKPIMTKMVDKYEVKLVVSKLIGEEYVIKNYGIWDDFDEIDFDALPSQFVLKTTHDQGGVVIVKDKGSFNKKQAKTKLHKHLRFKHYNLSREWPYKNVKPRILAEEFMEDPNTKDLKDYKFFCFDGKVKALFIAAERQSGNEVKFDFFDREFNHLDIVQSHPKSNITYTKPDNFDEMVRLAERLSKGVPHVRVDLYTIGEKIYFGEFTFFHHGGLVGFTPHKWDYTFGSWIDIDALKSNSMKL